MPCPHLFNHPPLFRHYSSLRTLPSDEPFFLPVFDRSIAVTLPGVSHRVYVKAVTHATLYLAPKSCESRNREAFLVVAGTLQEQSHVFDIGANVGLFTWEAASRYHALKVTAFEPDYSNYALLRKTLTRNKTGNVDVFNLALSDTIGQREFKSDPLTSATGSLSKGEQFTERHFGYAGCSILVDTTTVDEMSKKLGAPALMKIDVEGHEASVLAGARETIRLYRPSILLECFEHPFPFAEYLESLQYVIYDADRGGPASRCTTNYWIVQADSDANHSLLATF